MPHLTPRADHTRLGFAELLKSFRFDGRFPTTPYEAPTPVVAFLATQIELDSAAWST